MPGNRDVAWQTGALKEAVIKGLGSSRRENRWRPDAFAVIVGIDTYNDPQIPNLRFARKDAEAIYQVLTDPAVGRFNPDNVIILLDADATERKIRSALGTKLPRRTSRDSTVCIYYAGHGAPVIDIDARRNTADNIEKYLVPHDAEADDLRSTAISMDSIQQYFSWLDAKQVICFFDTCYSGAAGGRSFERDLFRTRAIFSDEHLDRLAGEGRVVITACATNEISLESSEKGHGLFTYHLIRGLQGEADTDEDGRVTVDELYDYVYNHVERDARLMDGRMSPVRKGSVRGRVYLTEVRQGSAEPLVESGPSPLNDDVTFDVSATDGHRQKWWAAIVAASTVAVAASVAWLWISSRSSSPVLPAAKPAGPPAAQVEVPKKAALPEPGPEKGPIAATGQVALAWTGSTDVQWSVVDGANKILAQGFAPAGGTSRVTVPQGDFFVVLKDFPEVRRLPVKVGAGATSTVTPLIGQLEVTWSGPSAVSAVVEDQNGRVLRKNWQIPSKGSGSVDLGPGRYSIVLPNTPRRPVTVLARNTVSLNLAPSAPPPASEPPSEPASAPTPPPVVIAPTKPDPIPRPAVLPYVPGQWKLPSTDNLGFVLIAEGSFLMGSDPKRHPGALLDERPQTTVQLPAFLLGRYEVTVEQYRACVDDAGSCKNFTPAALNGPPDRPVRFISWDEAVQYCNWLDRKLRSWSGTPSLLAAALSGARDGTAWKVRLPSEAEWEKAARGTKNQTYPWGDTIDPSKANYGNRIKEPTTVGIYPDGASPYGLRDMIGNVWEWTRSRPLRYPYRPNDDREDTRPSKDLQRMIRGGSFLTDDPWSAKRNTGLKTDRTDFVGFRVAIGPPQ